MCQLLERISLVFDPTLCVNAGVLTSHPLTRIVSFPGWIVPHRLKFAYSFPFFVRPRPVPHLFFQEHPDPRLVARCDGDAEPLHDVRRVVARMTVGECCGRDVRGCRELLDKGGGD